MERYLLRVTAAIAMVLFFGLTASAQGLRSAPKDFQTFFAKFRSAVERAAKTEVASMSRFPFDYAYDAGDSGKYTRGQFTKHFKDMFGPEPSKYFNEIELTFHREGLNYQISTSDATHFAFRKVGRTFKFVGLFVEP